MWTQGRFKTRRTPAHVARKTPDPRTKESYTVVGEIMPTRYIRRHDSADLTAVQQVTHAAVRLGSLMAGKR